MPCSSRICFLIILFGALTTTSSLSNNNNYNYNNLFTDQSSLATLKSYVSDPKNILKNGWSDSTLVCNWTGVTCGSNPLRVIGLNLSLGGLVGHIPPHLGNLTSLTDLLLTNNSFHGLIPSELSRLKQLENINFGFNDLSGEIPSWIGSLPKLQELRLYGNRLSGSIPTSIFNLTSLKIVELTYNQLSGIIPDEIGGLHYLETFQVGSNAFKGPLPQFVFNMSSLKILALSRNSFYGTLPDNLCQYLPNIQHLYFTQDRLSGQIPSKLSECKQLRILSLSGNNFHGSVPKSIANLSRATGIYLAGNELTGTLPEDIANLGNLQILHLPFNNIIGSIPTTLFNITTIKVISLNSNQLSGGLPPNCGLWVPNLEKLYLFYNNMSGSIPKSISNASQLTILDIGSNHFSGFIPNTLHALKNLEFLNLCDNSLTLIDSSDNILYTVVTLSNLKLFSMSLNPLSTTLPSSIGSNISNSLEILYLDHCNLRGHIPTSIANFSSLIILALHGNRFSGSIQPIGMLEKLQGLALHDNVLDGPIPSELCRLRFLSELFLHNNTLSGSIPQCLGDRLSLRKLYLASNKFSSTIPPTIWGITDILEVDLSSNSLTGSLPARIGKLRALTYFNVSNNQLSGNISSSIGDLQTLQSLSLGNNYFRGPIPNSMGNLLSLKDLDLSHNILSGFIPKSLQKLSNLISLNLSYNNLSGEIPSGGPFSKFAYQSFLHNDNLCGAPRLRVPPCKSAVPKKAHKKLILECVTVAIAAIIVTMAIILIIIIRRRKKKNVKNIDSELELATLRRVSRYELLAATNGFGEENLIGVGGFGSVYRGTLTDGLVVAIKVFDLRIEKAFQSFAAECEALWRVRHRNLVKIETCCSSPDFKALVLQYMSQGSLEKWLYSGGGFYLNLLQRLNVMIDVASGLEYLHFGYSPPIVHCDLKPSNVLLDENMVAHVADFGITKLLSGEDSMTQTMTLATIGYMAPEYGDGGVVSRRGDVYSFGIMLMEVITKKNPIDEIFSEEMNLKQWVQYSLQNEMTELIDSDLLRFEGREHLITKECVISILELALACSASSPLERIDMKIAVSSLEKIKKNFLKNIG